MSQMSIQDNSQFDFNQCDDNDNHCHHIDQDTDDVCIISFDNAFSNPFDQCIEKSIGKSIDDTFLISFDNAKSTDIIKFIFANNTNKFLSANDNAAIANKQMDGQQDMYGPLIGASNIRRKN